jgi:hypothetical protein
VRPSLLGTIRRPSPVCRDGVVPAVEFNDVGVNAVAFWASVDLILVRNSGQKIQRRFVRIKVVAAILGEMESVGVVLALGVVLRMALARMLPAVILGVPEADDGLAVKGIKGIDPDLIVEVGGVWIFRGVMANFATMLHAVEIRTKTLKKLRTGSHQMDSSGVIAKRPRHGVWNIVWITGVLGRLEHGGARTIEHACDCGSLRRVLAIWRWPVLCYCGCHQHQNTQYKKYLSCHIASSHGVHSHIHSCLE